MAARRWRCAVLMTAAALASVTAQASDQSVASSATTSTTTNTTSSTGSSPDPQARLRIQPANAASSTGVRMTPATSAVHGAGVKMTPLNAKDHSTKYRIQRAGMPATGASSPGDANDVPQYKMQPISTTVVGHGATPQGATSSTTQTAPQTQDTPHLHATPFRGGRPIGGTHTDTTRTTP